MNDDIEKTTIESGMWFSVRKSKSVAKVFMQRGGWFVDVNDGINIDAETGAAKNLCPSSQNQPNLSLFLITVFSVLPLQISTKSTLLNYC